MYVLDKNADVCKYKLPLFFSFHHTKFTYRSSVKELKMTEIHLYRGETFLLHSVRVEIFPGLYNFPDAQAILVLIPPASALNVDTPPFWHATHAIYVALPLRKWLRSIYFRKQVDILLYHQRNLRGISAGASASCLLKGKKCISYLPPTQLRQLVKEIFRSRSNTWLAPMSNKWQICLLESVVVVCLMYVSRIVLYIYIYI